MKDIMLVITISYFMLYGAISIVDLNKVQEVKAEEIQEMMPCELKDVFCYGEWNESDYIMPVEGYIRLLEKSSTQKDILHQVCEDKGFKEDFCEKDLYGIMMTESRGNCDVIGDQGKSFGCFQIQTKLHGITEEQAKDLRFASKWTLERMQRFGYPLFRSLAIRRHNGFGISTFSYLKTVNQYANH